MAILSNPNSWLAAVAILGGCALSLASYYNLVREKIEVGHARRNLIEIQNHINEQRLRDGKPLIDFLNTGILGGASGSQSQLANMVASAAPSGIGVDIGGTPIVPAPKLGNDPAGGKAG